MSAGVLNFLPHCPSLQTQFLNVKSMARRWQEKTSPQPHQATPREASPGGSLAASPSQRESSESCIASSPVTHDDDATPSGDWEPEQHADDVGLSCSGTRTSFNVGIRSDHALAWPPATTTMTSFHSPSGKPALGLHCAASS